MKVVVKVVLKAVLKVVSKVDLFVVYLVEQLERLTGMRMVVLWVRTMVDSMAIA